MTPWFQKQAKRPGSRSSSRIESDLLTSPPPSRRDEDASAAATITGLMQNDHGLQAVVDLSDRPHTSSKYDYLFEERGGGRGSSTSPFQSTTSSAALRQALIALLPNPVYVPPQTMSLSMGMRVMASGQFPALS